MNWKKFKFEFGKYRGQTMWMVYVNDYQYLDWLSLQNVKQKELRDCLKAAVEHKNSVDPWSK